VFLLKLVVVVLLGSFWIKFGAPITVGVMDLGAVPVGLLAGLILIHILEKRRENRRTFFAVIVVVGILSFFLPAGIVL